MSALAQFFKRSDAMTDGRSEGIRAEMDPFRLRALPNDNIYFWSKRIDNSRVVRQADPAVRGECWSAIGAAALLLALAVSIIAPHAATTMEGYKLEALKQERQMLLDQKRDLEVKEASLLRPERLTELAKANNLTSPAADQIVHLDGQMDAALASNHQPGAATAQGR
jgi:cell division protein FtsL